MGLNSFIKESNVPVKPAQSSRERLVFSLAVLRYPYPENNIFNRVISDISVIYQGKPFLLFIFHRDRLACRNRDSESGFPWYNGNN